MQRRDVTQTEASSKGKNSMESREIWSRLGGRCEYTREEQAQTIDYRYRVKGTNLDSVGEAITTVNACHG